MGCDIVAVYGIHGDEKSPLRLLPFLKRLEIPVVGPVNRLAWEHNVRYVDRDLNRIFRRRTVSHEERYKPRLENLLCSYDVILDLHSHRMQGAPMIIKCVETPLPAFETVWDVRTTSIKGSFCQKAFTHGTVCIPIELPRIEAIQHDHIRQAKQAVQQVLQADLIKQDGSRRLLRRACQAGVFTPLVRQGTLMQRGDVLGVLRGEKPERIIARTRGVVKQIQREGYVDQDESLVGIVHDLTD